MERQALNGWIERWQARLLWAATLLVAMLVLAITLVLAVGATRFLQSRGWRLGVLLGANWNPLAGHFEIGLFIVDTIIVTALAMAMTLPFGLGVAVFGAYVASSWERTALRWLLTVLAAVPSVAMGWWGLAVVVPGLRRIGGGPGFSLLAAGAVLAVMLLPTFGLLALEVLDKVPEDWHQASLALGASEDQNLLQMALRVSLPGLKTAFLTAVARAMGETVAVQMVIGGAVYGFHGMLGPGATLTTQILTDMAILPLGHPAHGVLDLMAVILLAGLTLLTIWAQRGDERP